MMTTTRRRDRRAGFAFVAALLVILVVAILLMAILTMAMSAQLLASSRHEFTQALYLAEAGFNAMVSDWRVQGAANPPAQPYIGELANGSAPGSYHVTWAVDPLRDDWVTVTSTGTVNTGIPGTVYHVNRTVEVRLDTDGDWAWNHVYYSDSDVEGMDPPEYAVINGNGDVEVDGELGQPSDFTDHPNGPGGGMTLPSPMWDLWHDWVQYDMTCDPITKEQIPRDPDGDGTADPRWPDQATLPACTETTVYAADSPDRHMYWYGTSPSTALDYTGHAADGHAGYDENFFMPDWYGFDNPDAYVCSSSNKPFTVIFGKDNDLEAFTGNYFVHGDVQIKNSAQIKGTIIATGDITFYGVANASIEPEVVNPTDPCDERVYYPTLIAGRDVLVRDQGVGEDDLRERLRVSGIIWAGESYRGQASNVEGCVVSPSVTLGGNYLSRYGIYELDGCEYQPGELPPPWFREPDRGEMQPVPRTWRER
jgi:type II secretory pathway pseudopilin PulG